MLKVVILSFLLIFLIAPINITQAQSESNPTVRVDHVAGVFEKIQEKITQFFKFNKDDQAKYREYLAEKRLAELKYIIDNNQIDSIEEVGSRYETYIGSLTNYVVDNSLTSQKPFLLNMYNRHQQILTNLEKNFPGESGWWLVMEHDININKISADRIENI